MKTQFETIDEYIATFPKEIGQMLESLRIAVRNSAPRAQEVISYGVPTFKLNGNLVHFGAYKNHISFYPGGPSAIDAFEDELSGYAQSKGTIRFPLDQPIPLELVKRIVRFRVQENKSRK